LKRNQPWHLRNTGAPRHDASSTASNPSSGGTAKHQHLQENKQQRRRRATDRNAQHIGGDLLRSIRSIIACVVLPLMIVVGGSYSRCTAFCTAIAETPCLQTPPCPETFGATNRSIERHVADTVGAVCNPKRSPYWR
jgi:hypothetical protein